MGLAWLCCLSGCVVAEKCNDFDLLTSQFTKCEGDFCIHQNCIQIRSRNCARNTATQGNAFARRLGLDPDRTDISTFCQFCQGVQVASHYAEPVWIFGDTR